MTTALKRLSRKAKLRKRASLPAPPSVLLFLDPRTCLTSEILWQSTRFIVFARQQHLQVNLRIE